MGLALLIFILVILPNSKASSNVAMVQVFQPDESAPLPSLFNMIQPAGSVNQALRNFIFYKYYFYGFPYFSLSALVLLPLKWLGQLGNIPLVMLVLRQLISVLPMLLGLLLLVYMQDGFRTYRSPLVFIILAIIPAVVENNLWWHPDGLTFLLVALTLFFLWKDDLRLGKYFVFAAISCGVVTALKLVGVYFFLTIAIVLLLSLLQKKANWKRIVGMGMAFLFVMIMSYIITNPFLLSHWARTEYFNVFRQQTDWLSEGYGVIYPKGLAAAWPLVRQYFGGWLFLLFALGIAIWQIIKRKKAILPILIISWLIPLTISVIWFSHFKFQYWMPAALPLFSSVIGYFPETLENRNLTRVKGWVSWLKISLAIIGIIVLLIQVIVFVVNDSRRIVSYSNREANNPQIAFYQDARSALQPVEGIPLNIYYDYRLYMPLTPNWTTTISYDLLDYNYIKENKFDVLMLLEQRIKDYTNPNVQGVDPAEFVLNHQFYSDAEKGALENFHLIYRDETGLVFVKDVLFTQYFH